MLAGCAAALPGGTSNQAGGPCRSEQLNQFVGQKATAELGAKMLEVSGARILRWVAPGMAVTMDFQENRLTVMYDRDSLITQASCG